MILKTHPFTGADLSTIEAAIARAWNGLPSPEFHERSIALVQIRRISGTCDCVERWMRIKGNNSQDLHVVITDPGFDGRVRRSVPVMYLGDGLLAARSNPEFFQVGFHERSPLVEVQFDSGQLRWLEVPVRRPSLLHRRTLMSIPHRWLRSRHG